MAFILESLAVKIVLKLALLTIGVELINWLIAYRTHGVYTSLVAQVVTQVVVLCLEHWVLVMKGACLRPGTCPCADHAAPALMARPPAGWSCELLDATQSCVIKLDT